MGLQYNPETGELEEVADDEIDSSNYGFGYGTETPNTSANDYDFWADIGISPDTTMENWKSPSNAEIEESLKGNYDFAGLFKQYGSKALDLFKTNGAYDPKKLLTLAGGAYAASRPSGTAPTGYQGKIPKLTATRNMLTAPPVGRRPGSGGIDYGGGVTYRTPEGELVQSNERTMEELRRAAVSNPFNRGATFEGQQGMGQSDLAELLQRLNPSVSSPAAPSGGSQQTDSAGTSAPSGGAPQFTTGMGSGSSSGAGVGASMAPAKITPETIQKIKTEMASMPQTQASLDTLLLKYAPAEMAAAFPEFGNVADYNNAARDAFFRVELQERIANKKAFRAEMARTGQQFILSGNEPEDFTPPQFKFSQFPKMSAIPQAELDAARAKLTPEQQNFIDWKIEQIDPMQHERIGDAMARGGANPYLDAAGAQAAIDRRPNGAWTNPNWREELAAAQQARAIDQERSRQNPGPFVIGGGSTASGGITDLPVAKPSPSTNIPGAPNMGTVVMGGAAPAAPAAPADNWMSNLSFDPNAMPQNFDWQKYVATNTDLGAAGIDTAAEAMRHYQNYGMAEKRSLGVPQVPASGAPDLSKIIFNLAGGVGDPRLSAPRPYDAPERFMTPSEDAGEDYAKGGIAGGLKPEGFILPADFVSHVGNGSSEAGLRLLAEKYGAEPIKGAGDGMSDSIPTTIGGTQEARVANEEAFISPEMVKRIGGGDAKKGAKKLYAMMDSIREERTGTKEQGKQIDPNKFMPGGSVQKFQAGGTTPSGATGSESSLSNWGGDYVTNMLGQGAALANAPYQAYTGPLTAGASGLQQQAFTQAGALQTPDSIGQAAGTAGGIANLAANMRYTPQTTDFLGGANMSGLGMSPSYGMGMPQQQPVPMPTGQGPTNKLPVNLPPGFQQEPTMFAAGPHRVKGPANFQQDTLEQAFGGSQYDPATGIESRDIRPLTPNDPRYSQRVQTMPKISEEFRPPGAPEYGLDPVIMDDQFGVPKDKMYRGPMESPDRFAIDGGMTGGVMQPPSQQAGLPGLMQPQASQQAGNIAQQYMNPYLESALRPQMDEARRQADISRMADAGRLTQAGAFGGSRQAIMESEGRRNLMDKQNQMLSTGYATAYDKAMEQFNADQTRRAQEAQFGATFGLDSARTGIQGAQAQAQAGAQQSAADINSLKALLDAGAVERGIESEGIAADKAQFEEARLNPFNMVQFQQSLLSGMPLASQSYSIPGASGLQQFAGGATTVDQLLKILSGQTAAIKK